MNKTIHPEGDFPCPIAAHALPPPPTTTTTTRVAGRIATNIRQGANALKEGQREIPGLLNNMSKDEYRMMLEEQVEAERRNKEAQRAELDTPRRRSSVCYVASDVSPNLELLRSVIFCNGYPDPPYACQDGYTC